MTNPKVSIIIPCYNQGRYVAEAIESCLGQRYLNTEIIVVNDGSTDDSRAACSRYQSLIRYLEQANSGLPAAARNTGILASTGDYLQFLDADDRLLPDKISEQVDALRSHPEVGVVYSDGYLIDESGARLGPSQVNHQSGWVLHQLLTLWGTQVAAPLVRRTCLARVGIFCTDREIRGAEDTDLWMRLATHYQFLALPQFRWEYRVGTASVSSDSRRMLRAALTVVRRHRTAHGNCAECRRASAAGVRRWKTVTSYHMMSHARARAAIGDWARAVSTTGFVLRNNPRHLVRLLAPSDLPGKLRRLLGATTGTPDNAQDKPG